LIPVSCAISDLADTACLSSDVYVQRGVFFACANGSRGPVIAVKGAWLSCMPVPRSPLLTSPGLIDAFPLALICITELWGNSCHLSFRIEAGAGKVCWSVKLMEL